MILKIITTNMDRPNQKSYLNLKAFFVRNVWSILETALHTESLQKTLNLAENMLIERCVFTYGSDKLLQVLNLVTLARLESDTWLRDQYVKTAIDLLREKTNEYIEIDRKEFDGTIV